MKTLFTLFLSFWVILQTEAQDLTIFDSLIGKTWEAEGVWGNGQVFKQKIQFEYGLDHTIVKSKTFGFTDNNQKDFGLRNEGIRRVDSLNQVIEFWEFDVFGGLTDGIMVVKGQSFYYQYKYGNSIVTDYWTYKNDNTYTFKVGIYDQGEWSNVFLETEFKGISK